MGLKGDLALCDNVSVNKASKIIYFPSDFKEKITIEAEISNFDKAGNFYVLDRSGKVISKVA